MEHMHNACKQLLCYDSRKDSANCAQQTFNNSGGWWNKGYLWVLYIHFYQCSLPINLIL